MYYSNVLATVFLLAILMAGCPFVLPDHVQAAEVSSVGHEYIEIKGRVRDSNDKSIPYVKIQLLSHTGQQGFQSYSVIAASVSNKDGEFSFVVPNKTDHPLSLRVPDIKGRLRGVQIGVERKNEREPAPVELVVEPLRVSILCEVAFPEDSAKDDRDRLVSLALDKQQIAFLTNGECAFYNVAAGTHSIEVPQHQQDHWVLTEPVTVNVPERDAQPVSVTIRIRKAPDQRWYLISGYVTTVEKEKLRVAQTTATLTSTSNGMTVRIPVKDSGEFVSPAVKAGEYHLTVSSPHCVPFHDAILLEKDLSGVRIDLVPKVRISGHVSDSRGAACPKASVTVLDLITGWMHTCHTSWDGTFDAEIRPSEYLLRIVAENHERVVQRLEVTADRELNVSLRATSALTGRILSEVPIPKGSFVVLVLRDPIAMPLGFGTLLADGSFSIETIEGQYWVVLVIEGIAYRTKPVDVAAGKGNALDISFVEEYKSNIIDLYQKLK